MASLTYCQVKLTCRAVATICAKLDALAVVSTELHRGTSRTNLCSLHIAVSARRPRLEPTLPSQSSYLSLGVAASCLPVGIYPPADQETYRCILSQGHRLSRLVSSRRCRHTGLQECRLYANGMLTTTGL